MGTNGWIRAESRPDRPVRRELWTAPYYRTIQTGDVTGDGQVRPARTGPRTDCGPTNGDPSGWTQVGGLLTPRTHTAGTSRSTTRPSTQSISTARTRSTSRPRPGRGTHLHVGTGRVASARTDAHRVSATRQASTKPSSTGPSEAPISTAMARTSSWPGTPTGWPSTSGTDPSRVGPSSQPNALSLSDPLWSSPWYYFTIQTGT